ncbi:MAG: hypothetical protein JXR76_15305 [Deltaproteobacteria bacterium]|nr:hypothetical protein [Deltaproteobacteria bacterium]
METDIKIPPNGAALRIFVKPLQGATKSRLQVIAIVKKKKGPHFGLSLPERQELFDAGWIPEIKYQFGEHNTVEITVSPRVSPFKGEEDIKPILSVNKRLEGGGRLSHDACELPLDHKENCGGNATASSVMYEVSYEQRAIRINGILLSKPHFDSENDLVFDYIYKNPGRKISLDEIERELKRPLKKKLGDIVRDLGFRHSMRMFFPDISKTAVKFVRTISIDDFQRSGCGEIRIIR